MSEWQPIETAPKDGTPVIVLTERGVVMKAETADGVAEDGWVWIASDEGVHPACWDDGVCWSSNSDYEPSDAPQFWMPLHAPPVSGSVGDAKHSDATRRSEAQK